MYKKKKERKKIVKVVLSETRRKRTKTSKCIYAQKLTVGR